MMYENLIDDLVVLAREYRSAYNISRDELSVLSGIEKRFIEHIEQGRKRPSFDTVLALLSHAGAPRSSVLRLIQKHLDGFPWISP